MNLLARALIVLILGSASLAHGESCKPFEMPADPTDAQAATSTRVSATWCTPANGGTSILLSFSDSSHPWMACKNPLPLSIFLQPRTRPLVVDEISDRIPPKRFRPMEPSNSATLESVPPGPAIYVGPRDSPFVFVCESGDWYWYEFSH